MGKNQKLMMPVLQAPRIVSDDKIEAVINIFKGVEEYILDTTGVIVSSNLEAVTITGYEEWEIIGRHFSIFYTAEDQIKREYESDLEKAIRLGFCFVSSLKMKKRNSPFWAKLKIVSLRDATEVLTGFRVTIQDATHKAIYSHNLNLVKDEYLNLFNNPFIGIFKCRISDFRILMANEKAEAIFGKGWSKRTFDNYFVDRSQFDTLVHFLTSTKKVENIEFEVPLLDGQGKIWVSCSCKLFAGAGFFEGVIVDITERRNEIEKTLNLSNELESFIYHASHDLRSPITSIYGLVNLLVKEMDTSSVPKYAKLIEGRLQHLDNILRDIVEIAFNTAVEVVPESIDLGSEIQTVLDNYSKTYPHITISLDVEKNIEFISDLTRVRSILRNVISNSFKYHRLSETSFVKVVVMDSDTQIKILVEDNGIGIKPEFSRRIFSLFYKATDSYKGNGLGLYLVKSMLMKLHGSIEFKSAIGAGTLFEITLPKLTSR